MARKTEGVFVYKLIYKSQFVAGFDEDQILGNLAQLLQLKPKAVRLMFLSGRSTVIKILDSTAEVERWRAAFLEAGVYLDVVNIAAPDADSIADQIELELELHTIDEEFDEEESPRKLFVKKIIADEEAANVTPDMSEEAMVEAVAHTDVKVLEQELEQELQLAEQRPLKTEESAEEKIATDEALSDNRSDNKKEATAKPTSVTTEGGPFADFIFAPSPIVETQIKEVEAQIKASEADEPASPPEREAAAKVDLESSGKSNRDDTSLDEEYVDVNFHKSSFLWGMLVILLAIVTTASIILWLKQPLWTAAKAPAQADKVVAALATESLFALAYVDVQRLQQLPDVLQKNTGMKNLPAPDAKFWRSLEQSGADISQQLKHVWIAAYRASNNETRSLWVLSGKFNAEQVRAWLKKNYLIDEDTPQQIVFSVVDENTCEKQPAMMAVIESDRILLGAPERVAAFRGRLDAAAPAGMDVADWQRISAGQMLSVAVFNPSQFNDAITATTLTRLAIDAAPLKGIYIGLAPRLLPPALEFSAVLVGADAQFIKASKDNLAQALATAKNTFVKDWPETLPLYERIKLRQTEQQLRASLLFDEHVQQQLQVWGQSLFAPTFTASPGTPAAIPERINEKPRRFKDLASAQLPEFATTRHLNNSINVQTTAGPFGVGISSMEATDEGVAINLDINAFNLPNLGQEADAVQLRITDIVDHQDQSLIASSSCTPQGIRQATSVKAIYEGTYVEQGKSQPYLGLQGTKKIMLPPDFNLSKIGAIKGEIEYRLPTKVERLTVDAPLAGKVISSNGMQLRFLSSGTNNLYFQQSGNADGLLQVNALNADAKVLGLINTARTENNVLGSVSTTNTHVQGAVAAAEVIVASNVEKHIYPFSFGRIQPPEKTFAVEKPAPELLSAEKLKILKQDTPPSDVKYPYQTPQQTSIAGPALIAVNHLAIVEQKLSLTADIYLRNQHPLSRQLSAVRLVITEVEDSAGNLHPVEIQVPVSPEHQGGSWSEEGYRPDPTQPWLRGQLELREQELGVSDAVALWGKLVFLAPRKPIAIPIPFQFGMEWNGTNSVLKLSRWEAGRLLFDIRGNFSEIMAITALDEEGAVISQAAELRNNQGLSQVELAVKQRPAAIEFSIAREQQTAEFPFEIRAGQ
jgi:hypothetical protein